MHSCSRCGASETRTVAALGHDWVENVQTIEHPAEEGQYIDHEAVHEPQEITKEVWVVDEPAVEEEGYYPVISEAYTEDVYTYKSSDEQVFSSREELDAYLSTHEGVTDATTYEKVNHDAVYGDYVITQEAKEEVGHYETVGTGEYQDVLVKEAWTETIKEPVAAWTETITTYSCSRCGIPKPE